MQYLRNQRNMSRKASEQYYIIVNQVLKYNSVIKTIAPNFLGYYGIVIR